MGDVTFGACCIDDYSAAAMGCDFLVHYGHSCLVPVGVTTMPCMYVFVDIAMDVDHLVETVQLNVPRGSKLVLAGAFCPLLLFACGTDGAACTQLPRCPAAARPSRPHLRRRRCVPLVLYALVCRHHTSGALLIPCTPCPVPCHFSFQNKCFLSKQKGTIQFASAIQLAKQQLAAEYPALLIPKAPPLSPGEVLGCTAPVLPTGSADVIVFVADGRFHLEAIMIANPTVPALRYDPYGRILIKESYDQEGMRSARRRAIEAARGAQRWGLVLGTLGRQGNPRTLETLRRHFEAAGLQHTLILLSEVTPTKLQLFSDAVDAWVQVACPRLSIDWGEGFTKPTLNPFEALVALGVVPAWWEPQDEEQEQPAGAAATMQLDFEGSHGAASSGGGVVPPPPGASRVIPKYPMDYYARDGGEWNSSYHKTQPKPNALPAAAEASAAIAAATK